MNKKLPRELRRDLQKLRNTVKEDQSLSVKARRLQDLLLKIYVAQKQVAERGGV